MSDLTKTCSKCKQSLSTSDFFVDRRTFDGLQHWCKSCRRICLQNRPYERREADRARHRGYEAKYRQSRVAECPKCHQVYQGRKCKQCQAMYMREYAAQNRDAFRIARAAKYQRDKQKPDFRATVSKRASSYYAKARAEVYAHYGNKCFCCGLDDVRFLTIDHVNGDGHKYKHPGGKRIAGTTQLRWIRDNNYPDDIRLACWNCNCARQYNEGVCPHDQDRQVD